MRWMRPIHAVALASPIEDRANVRKPDAPHVLSPPWQIFKVRVGFRVLGTLLPCTVLTTHTLVRSDVFSGGDG